MYELEPSSRFPKCVSLKRKCLSQEHSSLLTFVLDNKMRINGDANNNKSILGLSLTVGFTTNLSAQYNNDNNFKITRMEYLKAGVNTRTFKSFGLDLVGNLYLPEGFDPDKKYNAIVSASPFPQVKEQIPATYGPEMTKRGMPLLKILPDTPLGCSFQVIYADGNGCIPP